MRIALALVAAFTVAASAVAAPPEVPVAFVYQGVLTDNLGNPRTGNVDLKVRIFDGGTGGTLLYMQSYSAVALDAGTFSIVIGPTGAATDPPGPAPLTASLGTAVAGDLAATGPQRWIELQVGTSSALARTRLQSTPFALRATSSETADFANEAGTVDTVDGIPSEFVSQLWNHTNLDNNGPANNDPLEGLADVDGDGAANFVDADNDGDGVNDAAEIAAGYHPNLRTPLPTSLSPNRGLTFEPTLVTFGALGLEPGFTATIGPLTLTPLNVTAAGFQASVGPLSPGIRPLTIVNPNGQSRVLANAFTHADTHPGGGVVDVFGAQQVLLGGVYATGLSYAVSTDGDWFTDATFPSPAGRFRWDGGGRVTGLVCTPTSLPCQIRYLRDADGDFDLADETGVALESVTNVQLYSPSLVFDGAGRPGGGYIKRLNSTQGIPVVFHDRNGDGDFGDANERLELTSLVTPPAIYGEAAFDPAGRLAYVYGQNGTASIVVVAYDRTGDGDFGDANESVTIGLGAQPACLGATFDGHGRLAVLHGTSPSSLSVRRDLNGDGDFLDAGESTSIAASGATGCAIASGPGVDLAISLAENGDLRVLRDLNGDLDFDDPDESRLLDTIDEPIRQSMRIIAGGRAVIGTQTELAIMAP